eukprot:maker-scaffold361_size196684-snap-gene-0.20 protein:Tk09268 transcript:maker-scaffold361_size196684-snap-gene-0.20-mRNA-1 annotation:"hypothetical protein TcasGA2_TC011954"
MSGIMPTSEGINSDCLELYKEAKKFLTLSQKSLAKLEVGLLDLINTKCRQEALLTPTNVGKLKSLHDIEPMLESAQSSVDKIQELEARFLDIARDEKSCRKTYFFRIRYLVTALEKQKLSILFLIQQYVMSMLNLVAGRHVEMTQASPDWLYVFQSADNFNKILVAARVDFESPEAKHSLIHSHFKKDAHIHENFFPSYPLNLKQFSSSKILQAVASQRSWFAANEVTRSVVVGLDKRQLELASAEVSWLNVPNIAPNGTPADVPPVLQMAMHGAKNKDGNGNKRKNRNSQTNGDSPTSDYHSQNGGNHTHFHIIDDFVSHEEGFLGSFFHLLSQVPGLLGKSVLKYAKAGGGFTGERISRTARVKMSEYYHDLLWHNVGSLAEKILLWSDIQDIVYVPFALQSVRTCLGLSNLLQDNLYAKFGEDSTQVLRFMASNKLLANPQKTNVMVIRNNLSLKPRSFKVGNHSIYEQDNIKLLGVNFAANLSWNYHVTTLISQLNQRIGLLKRLLAWIPRSQILPIPIVDGLILSKIRYALPVFGQIQVKYHDEKNGLMAKVQSVLNKLMRVLANTMIVDKFLRCLSESSRAKTMTTTVPTMRSGTLVSNTGRLFYDTLKDDFWNQCWLTQPRSKPCSSDYSGLEMYYQSLQENQLGRESIVRLNNRTHPDMIRDFVEHGSFDPEEFPFLEEVSVLRRLSTTLYCLRNWAVSRGQATLQTWNVQDFLIITQGDLLNVEDCFGILQMETHDRNVHTKSINIQLFTHVQQLVCKEIHECQRSIRDLPKENQCQLSEVCRTYSLATLQNIFPLERYWRQTGALPNTPSDYVSNFIDRILAPVFKSLEFLKIDIQQTIVRLTVKSFCDAWLEHIKTSRIKFSDWGAHQISLDFQALRAWMSANPYLKDGSRRYALLLDSIRQCEGVAKLLQSKPGEPLDLRSLKNKVSPISGSHRPPLSPVHEILDSIPAELYVPNQQQWMKLKTGTKISLPFCCR